MVIAFILLGCFVLSFVLTGIIRRYALAKNVIDLPNQRSSHSVPTPRGGGLSVVISFYIALFFLYWLGYLEFNTVLLLTGIVAVALIGFIDDHVHIRARYRLLVHFIVAGWGCYWIGIIPDIETDYFYYPLLFACMLYLVWLLNLYNFMDGIDGIASVEAITVASSACLILYLNNAHELIFLLSIFSVSVFAFLLWNWPPAKVFMGDSASGFIGMLFGILSLMTSNEGTMHFGLWLILLSVFIVDATYTLNIRFFRGEKIYHAHRIHTYQILSRLYGHKSITSSILFLNLLWLLPIALLANSYQTFIVPFIMLAWLPLLFLAIKYRAGFPEEI